MQSAAWIIDTWVDPGCLVLDPFAGLGTIGLAARTLGFDYLGAELVPEYATVANEAFATERLTLGIPA
jgi:DNA modification methylase